MEFFWVLIVFVLGIAIGILVLAIIQKQNRSAQVPKSLLDEKTEQLNHLENQAAQSRSQITELNVEKARLEETVRHLTEKVDEERQTTLKMQEQLKKDFELLANQILEKKSEKFTLQNSENLNQILNPLKTQIKEFEERITRSYESNIKAGSELKGQLQTLIELNNQIRKDAINLTRALKGDSKTRGDWGEMQLELILEKTGLEKDVHYHTQGAYTSDAGKRLIPDFVIHLPQGKNLIIDSKVSLVHYEKYIGENDEKRKEEHLKNHLNAMAQHVNDLGRKEYHKIYEIESPDFVIMFVPIEAAFHLAQAADHQKKLFNQALDKNVVIVTTGTLIATLKTVSFIWDQEKQRQNIEQIVDRGSKIYEKLAGFIETFNDIEKHIHKTHEAFDKAKGQLTSGRGNLVAQAHKMKEMGVNTSKNIPENFLRKAIDEDE